MGFNDHLNDHRPDLPNEAGSHTAEGYEPDDGWFGDASEQDRVAVMREWFLTRYCDPADGTPFNSQEGGYLYIHGGPYTASDELYSRFDDLADEEEIEAAVEDIESDGIYEWAPIHTEPDYDDAFDYGASARDEPIRNFRKQLSEIDALAGSALDEPLKARLHLLLFSTLITALETYLADTTIYWVRSDKVVFKNLVINCEEFKVIKVPLADILDRVDKLDKDVDSHLKQLIWHRLDKIAPIMSGAFGFKMPAIGELMRRISTRHDIVHRGGKTKDGTPVMVSADNLKQLRDLVDGYIQDVESALRKQFPVGTAIEVSSADFDLP